MWVGNMKAIIMVGISGTTRMKWAFAVISLVALMGCSSLSIGDRVESEQEWHERRDASTPGDHDGFHGNAHKDKGMGN